MQKKQLDLALVDEKNPPRSLDQLKGQKSGRPTSEKVGNRKRKAVAVVADDYFVHTH